MHRFDTAHECDGQTDRRTDRCLKNGLNAQSIPLLHAKNSGHSQNVFQLVKSVSTTEV